MRSWPGLAVAGKLSLSCVAGLAGLKRTNVPLDTRVAVKGGTERYVTKPEHSTHTLPSLSATMLLGPSATVMVLLSAPVASSITDTVLSRLLGT